MKYLLLIINTVLFLSGCASGGTVMLVGSAPDEPTPIENVQIFLEPPTRAFQVIALVNSSADTDDFMSTSGAETAALEKLREQAAIAGADGLIDINREVIENGAVISTSAWGAASATAVGSTATATGNSSGIGSLFRSYSIGFRANAIKFTE